MSDKFTTLPIDKLLKLIFNEENNKNEIFGIPKHIFSARNYPELGTNIFEKPLSIPLGVAAGPHSQLAQNIISAWLCGARYIELKTIQTLDEIEVAKPCIDMQDEGYNCEWSQELKIEESFHQYLNAWIIIHILNHKFNKTQLTGTQFNMSVGYNMEGILKENVQWFFAKMDNCKAELEDKIKQLAPIYPAISKLNIPSKLSNSITLSTMHGCPPEEIEQIANYLIEKRKLHTFVKLNPTLLGADKLRDIINKENKFETNIPDEAFRHDLKHDDAIPMIQRLIEKAKNIGVEFGLKLTNTLESVNHKTVFSDADGMMYMSGRALHPLSVNLVHKLQNEFKGELNISFAGGADCFNFADLVTCGVSPITVCTDILKPGGYGRLPQYISELQNAMKNANANSISEFILKTANKTDLIEAQLANLEAYVNNLEHNVEYKKQGFKYPSVKNSKKLDFFDCISAPCQDGCATKQDIPDYLHFTAEKEFDKAFETILKRNSQPAITGNICDQLCQQKCIRLNYDDPLLIREIKRFVEENHTQDGYPSKLPMNGKKVAIIGAGPTGLASAFYLLLNGFVVDIYEQKNKVGGMVSGAVPYFRLDNDKINNDFNRVKQLGAEFHFNANIDKAKFSNIHETYDYVHIAVGAQKSAKLGIANENTNGVIDALNFLYDARLQKGNILGKNVAIVGGGNSAMDAARSAYRLVGENGSVTVLYRRRIKDMPADLGEIHAVIEEGIEIIENCAPLEILIANNVLTGIKCAKTKLVKNGTARPKPVIIENSEHDLAFDIIIPAIGQELAIDFVSDDQLKAHPNTLETKLKNVYIGGDAYRGAATAIKAIADGRKISETISKKANVTTNSFSELKKEISYNDLMAKRYIRQKGQVPIESDIADRQNFKPVSFTLNKEAAIKEAARCLQCDLVCSVCVSVCPNRANYMYEIEPVSYNLQKAKLEDDKMTIIDDKLFSVKQKYQIINIDDFCNECGNCTTFCPTSGSPYKDKPKFYLTTKSFNNATDGYFFTNLPNKKVLIYKEHGGMRTIEKSNNEWIYETDHVYAKFKCSDFSINEVKFKTPCVKQAHFTVAAEMSVIFESTKYLY